MRIYRSLNTPLRVRFVTLSTSIWGAENSLLTLATELADRHSLALELVAPEGRLFDEWRARKLGSSVALPAKYADMTRRRDLMNSQAGITHFLGGLPSPDVVHSHHQWTHVPVAFSTRKVSVLDLHDFVPTRLGRILQAVAAWRASISFVASQTVRRQLPRWLWSKTSVLNRPVAEPELSGLTRTDECPPSFLRLIVVCRPDPNKMFADAVAPILKAMKERDELVVVGGLAADYADGMSDSYEDTRIKFLGRLEGHQLDQAWRNADVHVLTSAFEPFGRVVVEAAMRGLPSIVHSQAGAAAAVAETRSGVLVEDWAEIERVLDGLRDTQTLEDLQSRLDLLVLKHAPEVVADEYSRQLRNFAEIAH